jgi:hypothetical protein
MARGDQNVNYGRAMQVLCAISAVDKTMRGGQGNGSARQSLLHSRDTVDVSDLQRLQ